MKRQLSIVLLVLIMVTAVVCLLHYLIPQFLFPKLVTVQAYERRLYNEGIYTFNIRERNFVRLTPENMQAYRPAWSPDGQHMAYIYKGIKNETGISLFFREGRNSEIILSTSPEDEFFLTPARGGRLAWSPDSQRILFNAYSEKGVKLLILDIRTGQVSSLALSHPTLSSDIASCSSLSFSWSRTGTLAIEVDNRIYLVNVETREASFLADGMAPSWKPDGELLTFLCEESERWRSLCTISPESGEKTVLFQPKQCCIGEFQWSPDERFIIYRESAGESDPIYLTILDTKTGRPHRIYEIDWLDEIMVNEVIFSPK